MTLPVSVRVTVIASFPTRVQGSGFVTLAKANGIWTVGINYALLGSPIPVTDPSNKAVAIFDLTTGAYNLTTLATLIASAVNNYRIVTAAGDVTVLPSDAVILLNKTVGAATNIILPLSAARNGAPIRVKDYKKDANANNITFVLAGTETLDGLLQAAADVAGVSKIDINGDERTLYPLQSGGWYL